MLRFFLGLGSGNFASGLFSQILQSRRLAVFTFLVLGASICLGYPVIGPIFKMTAGAMYTINFAVAFTLGNLSLVTLFTAEQFGTNNRATATSLLTNGIRAGVIPMVFLFQSFKGGMQACTAAALAGAVLLMIAFWVLVSFGRPRGAIWISATR